MPHSLCKILFTSQHWKTCLFDLLYICFYFTEKLALLKRTTETAHRKVHRLSEMHTYPGSDGVICEELEIIHGDGLVTNDGVFPFEKIHKSTHFSICIFETICNLQLRDTFDSAYVPRIYITAHKR